MTDLHPRRILRLGLALIVAPSLVLAVLQAYLALAEAPALARSHAAVVHTFEVIATVEALERAIRDAERGQLGFLITEDEAYLTPYRSGVEDAPALAGKLEQLTANDAEQQPRMRDVERMIALNLAEMKAALDVREREGIRAARDVVRTNRGLDTMRALTGVLDATIAAERARLAKQLERAEDDERSSATGAWAGGALALGVVALGAALVLFAFRDLRRSEAARYESEERFRLFVESQTDYAISLLDPEGRVIGWNAGAACVLGYAAGEIVGRDFSCFFIEEDREAGAPKRALETAAREGKYEAELRRARKDGTRFMASVLLARVLDPSGRLAGFLEITRDVTQRVEQQKALEQARAALAQSQKMEALGQLSGGVAHDFNNLLHVIGNALDALRRRMKGDDPDATTFVEMASRSANRAAALTQRILAFSRRQPLDPRPIQPNKLVAGMTDLLRRTLGETVAIETVLGGGVWPVSADANQLETALLNLAVNARDAMPGGGKLTIETQNAFLDEAYAATHEDVKAGQYVMIALSDTGAGMSKEIAARAFEPFFTTKEAGKGTGLGLSQVYGFLKQSGGHVKIYSEPGEGTTVKLYLPRLAGAEDAAPAFVERPSPTGAAGETILVVEDDEDVRAFTVELLRELGHRVLVAHDAASALRALDEEPRVDLLFTDVGLPGGVDGRKLADEALRRRPALKVLFTTAYARNAIVHHGRLDPGVQLIVKPFTQADLANKIRRVLGAGAK